MTNLTFRTRSLAVRPGIAAVTRGLPVALVRIAAIAMVIAVLLSRSRPPVPGHPGPPPRRPTAAPLAVESRSYGSGALLFDPGTGLPLPAPPAGRMDLIHAGASPWRDELGRWNVVGFSNGLVPGAPGEPALVRISLPDGAVLDRFPIEHAPDGRPCWSPDLSARILFVDARGRLTRVDFDGAEGREAPRLATLSWSEGIPGSDGILAGDISWPTDPRLVGRVLVSLNPRSGGPGKVSYGAEEAWWLQLDQDRREVVAAGRLTLPSGCVAEVASERCPVIGTGHDGSLVLAYMERRDLDPHLRWRLRVVPVGLDPGTGAPVALGEGARTLAEGCIATRPAFSDDGRWVGCIPWPEGTRGRRMRRVSLTPMPGLR
jgi:hypothetical protein